MHHHHVHRIRQSAAGYTLIQLMITVAIVGILAGIAYPSYQQQVHQARRAAMQSDLMALAQYFERKHAEFGCYNYGADERCDTADDAAAPTFDGNRYDYYTVTVEEGSLGANTFTLRAAPKGSQAGDGDLLIDHAQRRFWDENDDDDIEDAGEDDWERG